MNVTFHALGSFTAAAIFSLRTIESNIYHILILVICFILIYAYRKRFFNFWENKK